MTAQVPLWGYWHSRHKASCHQVYIKGPDRDVLSDKLEASAHHILLTSPASQLSRLFFFHLTRQAMTKKIQPTPER